MTENESMRAGIGTAYRLESNRLAGSHIYGLPLIRLDRRVPFRFQATRRFRAVAGSGYLVVPVHQQLRRRPQPENNLLPVNVRVVGDFGFVR
jgi:hypothetical protein